MLTTAERNSLLLSLGFLLMGAGIKVWKKWRVEIGPFDPPATAASDTTAASAPAGAVPPDVPADSLPGDAAFASVSRPDSSRGAPADTLLPAAPKPARRAKAKPAKSPPACPVDPNSAGEDRLANLPGVGPRTAAALVAHREAQGPFREVRDLLQVKGIGEKKLALILPCLILSGAGAGASAPAAP